MNPTNVVTRDIEPGQPVPGALPFEAGPAEEQVAALKEEMIAAWQAGERPQVEEFLVRLPALRDHTDAAVQLIHQDILLRQQHGEPMAESVVLRRFPQWQQELQTLLARYRLPARTSTATTFPEIGESLGDFQLLSELGRGALGRVFLAFQPSLADRPVVLKMTPCHGQEHLSLARLQHTHIVPLYSVQDYPGRNLRVLCMPYLGGEALSSLLGRMRRFPLDERTGMQLVQELDAIQAAAPLACPSAGPARHFLARTSHVQAVCWIGACLAEALQYAHERFLIHLDIKPSNVLLAADGQPMLLDFHLAREPLQAGAPAPDWLGGTPLYLSPEQRTALAAVRNRGALHCPVDGRSDIYSLGLLLYEALADHLPAADPAPLHTINRQVSVGLSDVIHKCLAPNLRDRYQEAGSLALDLRLHLTDQPLRGVRNRSWPELWTKWRRRRPYALMIWAMMLAVAGALVTVGFLVKGQHDQRRQQVEAALIEGDQLFAEAKFSEAVRALVRGRSLVEGLSHGGEELKQNLDARLRVAQRAQAAQDLHQLADQVRFLVDFDSLPRNEARDLEIRCRSLWSSRKLLLEKEGEELPADLRKRVQIDLLDLALVWTELSVELAPGSSSAMARREALAVLDELEKRWGGNAALYRARQQFALALGEQELAAQSARQAEQFPAKTSWDHYVLGRFLLKQKDVNGAAAEVERAVLLQPQGFWPNYYLGLCAYRLKNYEEAVRCFSVCVALSPDRAVCYFNRALAWAGKPGFSKQTLMDYDRALELQPALAAAWLNRGLLHYREGDYEKALTDLQRALDRGADPAATYYNLALVYLAQKDRVSAEMNLKQSLRRNPDFEPAQQLRDQLKQGP